MKNISRRFMFARGNPKWYSICLAMLIICSEASVVRSGDGSPAARADALAEFDLTFSRTGFSRPVVRVRIEDQEYRFAICTTSRQSAFDVKLRSLLRARRFTLRRERETALETFRAPGVRIAAMPIPGLHEVLCLDLGVFGGGGDALDGMLGMDALGGFIIELDYDREKIAFLRDVPRDPGTRFKLVASNAVPVIAVVIGGLGEREFMLNTRDATEAVLARDDFAALLARQHLVSPKTIPVTTLFGESTTRCAVLRVPLIAGDYSHANLVCKEDSDFGRSPHNALGLDYLSRYRVTFDFPRHSVYLKPGRFYQTLRPLGGLLGVHLTRQAAHVVVRGVQKDSFAGRYIRPGDMLESIDGVRVETMSDSDVVGRLSDRQAGINLIWRRCSSDNLALPMPLPPLVQTPKDNK